MGNRKEKGIPTLDFKLFWDGTERRFKYTYYEKEMKNPIVIQKRSAMSRNQKYQILSNDLIRRLSNISTGGESEVKEKIRIMNEYTEQLKSSGYNFRETAEIIKSGSWRMKRKVERRQKEGVPLHREVKTTISGRIRKTSTDSVRKLRRNNALTV